MIVMVAITIRIGSVSGQESMQIKAVAVVM